MPSFILLSATVTTTAPLGVSDSIDARIYTTNAGVDYIEALLTLDPALYLAGTSGDRKAGVEIWMDLGGGLEQIPPSEVGEAISITEALDAYADTASFALVGSRWSPFITTAARAKNRVQTKLWQGAPGVEVYATLLDGYVDRSEFQAYPPVTTIQCLDASSSFSERETSTNIVENSNKTRAQWLTEFAAANGITLGTTDLGPNGSVPLVKAHSETGLPIDIARAVLSPCGVNIYTANRALQVTRYDPAAAIERDLLASDIVEGSLSASTPSTTSPNVIRIVSVKPGPSSGALATRTETITEETIEDYAPLRWQTSQTGAATATNGSPTAPTITATPVHRVVTVNQYLGNTITRSTVEEYEWYARMAANNELSQDGFGGDLIIPLQGYTVYKYLDGSWRADLEETFRLVRRTITTRELEKDIGAAIGRMPLSRSLLANVIRVPLFIGLANGIPINRDGYSIGRVTEERYFYHWAYAASHLETTGTPTRYLGTPITDTGNSVAWHQEISGFDFVQGVGSVGAPDEKTVTDFFTVLNAFQASDGTVYAEQKMEYRYTGGASVPTFRAGAYLYSGDNRNVGDTEHPYYQEFQYEELRQAHVERTIYTQIGEDQLKTLKTEKIGPATSAMVPIRVSTTTITGPGQMPEVELVESSYNAQQIESKVRDEVRAYLNGDLIESVHDEYCETEADQRTLAMTILRNHAAIPVTFSMPLEPSLHKDKWVTLDIPHIGITAKRLHIRTLTRNFADYTQEIEALYYPLEVAS